MAHVRPAARARAETGRWAYSYRFETVRGRATFRFRARIRRQPDYPFTTGTSRAVRVQRPRPMSAARPRLPRSAGLSCREGVHRADEEARP